MSSASTPVSVRLNAQTRDAVARFAKLTKRSKSFVINEAVESYMADRMHYLVELDAAVEDAKSGYGHSSEQIHDWMKSWGSEDELPAPDPDITPDRK